MRKAGGIAAGITDFRLAQFPEMPAAFQKAFPFRKTPQPGIDKSHPHRPRRIDRERLPVIGTVGSRTAEARRSGSLAGAPAAQKLLSFLVGQQPGFGRPSHHVIKDHQPTADRVGSVLAAVPIVGVPQLCVHVAGANMVDDPLAPACDFLHMTKAQGSINKLLANGAALASDEAVEVPSEKVPALQARKRHEA